MQKIAIVGVHGMLGTALQDACNEAGLDVKGYDLPDLDITKPLNEQTGMRPCDVLVNCAAFTDVDGAESRSGLAFAVNRDGADRLAEWCNTNGSRMIHISTDYVFDGTKKTPYVETDETRTLNVYGQSKLESERAVLSKSTNAVVVRTQSLFGAGGKNFVTAILAKLNEDGRLNVVSDQVSCPTYTRDLARGILRLMSIDISGILHCSAVGQCSWCEFARAIAEDAGFDAERISAVDSDSYPRPARRPHNSVLDKSLWLSATGKMIGDWRTGMRAYLAELGRAK